VNRRHFLKTTATGSSSLLLARPGISGAEHPIRRITEPGQASRLARPGLPDLSPARWIWFPSGRTLPNSFVLFRRELSLSAPPRRATGWICADSRYRLEVNGQRVQWGPAPCDPRWAEADPINLTAYLQAGKNVLGATVLFYGAGDGTWPMGKPGFLFWLEIEHSDGRVEKVVSDSVWKVMICRAWPPGRPKRWYLRSLQEEFDARLYPYEWSSPAFEPGPQWLTALALKGSPNKPALCAEYYEYQMDVGGGPDYCQLRPRSIPMLKESQVPVSRLAESFCVDWRVAPQDYFDFRVSNAFSVQPARSVVETAPGQWQVELEGHGGVLLTFCLAEQVVGWPGFTIKAPAGTTVELLVHEAHALGQSPLLNTHFDSWTRFICREGQNRFEPFDFESLRWLQLHIHNSKGPVVISQVGVRRRVFPWPNEPRIHTSDPALQTLFEASLNTLNNCAQETLVDGMARERQQYSGDGGHQLHAVHLALGEQRLVARYLNTWSQGLTKDGFFLDCWPAYDRLARLIERQLDLSGWGPILDHGVGFIFDCHHHYMYTGELDALREPYPRLLCFARYLQSLVGKDRLLPVENLGIPSVWIDHVAYRQQRHKQCAFNLYAAAAMQNALAPLCRAFNDQGRAEAVEQFGDQLRSATVRKFWSPERKLFINNLPWRDQEKSARTCDRSLATAILFDQCPRGQNAEGLRALAECPPEMGFSYPANAGWRLWALAKAGRGDLMVRDLRQRWATLASVKENNTLQEDWQVTPDSGAQWSHCAVVPLYMLYQGLLGLKPLAPGFRRYELRPQLGDITDLEVTAYTAIGPISLGSRGSFGKREAVVQVPPTGQGELVLPEAEAIGLPPASGPAPAKQRRYKLPPGEAITLQLAYL